MGLPEETGLRYVGRVGTGFTDAALKSLAAELKPLTISRSPFLDKIDAPVASRRHVGATEDRRRGAVPRLDVDRAPPPPQLAGIRRDKLPGDL